LLRRRRAVRVRFFAVVACASLLSVAGCGKKRDSSASREPPAPTLAAAIVDAAPPPAPVAMLPAAPLPKVYKTVLHTGDSTVGGGHGLAKALRSRFEADGSKYVSDTVNSASLLGSEPSAHLAESVAKHHPDLVLINLGTNEVFVPAPQALIGRIRAVVRNVGPRDCIWIGPPTWKGDKGIVQVLRDNVAPCKFFDSSDMGIERIVDGIHPTDKGGEDWAEKFWAFYHPG
jgi:acyl-CoA thioesterase-1